MTATPPLTALLGAATIRPPMPEEPARCAARDSLFLVLAAPSGGYPPGRKHGGKPAAHAQPTRAVRSGTAAVNRIKLWYAVFGQGEPVLLIHGGLGFPLLGASGPGAGEALSGDRARQPRPWPEHALRAAVRLRPDGSDDSGAARRARDSEGGAGRLERRRDHRARHRDPPSRAPEPAVRLRRQLCARRRQADAADDPIFNASSARPARTTRRCRRRPPSSTPSCDRSREMWATQPHYTKDQLRAITVPTVIFDGDHDEAIEPAHTAEMAALIPGAAS